MRVLFLTKYSEAGPSSRYRVFQFLPHLDGAGIDWELHALLGDRYVDGIFRGRRPGAGYLVARFCGRVRALLRARRFDVVFVQKELLPWLPAAVEIALMPARVPVVVDVDDAVHLPYHGHRLLAGKIPRVLARASLVLAGNRWLWTYAHRFNRRAILFPTVVDAARFSPVSVPRFAGTPVVGWIGSPVTVEGFAGVAAALGRVARETPFTLRLIGADAPRIDGVTVDARPWSLDTEADELRACDVGIMPLPDEEWSRGKCSLKLLQYMSTGLATVSSPRGSAPEIVIDGDNGWLADSEAEWAARLGGLVADAGARARMGMRARSWLESHYALSNYGPRLVSILHAVAERRDVADA